METLGGLMLVLTRVGTCLPWGPCPGGCTQARGFSSCAVSRLGFGRGREAGADAGQMLAAAAEPSRPPGWAFPNGGGK